MADYNSSYTGVQIDTAVGKALAPDSTPTAESAALITSGAVKAAMDGKVPVCGMGENLLRNWYFVNPVNQRGVTSVTQRNTFTVDAWKTRDASYPGSVSVTQNGIVIASSNNTGEWVEQKIPSTGLIGKSLTLSALTPDGLFTGFVAAFPSTGTALSVATSNGTAVCEWSGGNLVVSCRAAVTKTETYVAVKLELGTQQTLCHNEGTDANPVWVLNEVPDYEAELIKCQTSTADPSDTYANKTLATEQQIAYVESGTTASRAYVVGEYFCWNGLLHRVTSTISSGGTITPGTNCEQTMLSNMAKYWLDVTSQFSTASGATLKVLVNPAIRTIKMFFLENGLPNGSTAVTIPTQYAPDTSKLVYVSSTDSYRIGIFHGRYTQTPNSFGNIYEFHSFLRYYSVNREIAVYYPLANPAYAVTFDIEYVY